MLCLKSVLGRVRGTATMAFDEIDAGVGGTIAANVAQTLAEIGKSRQVLCITHLAAIAARADRQLRVLKEDVGEATVTAVEPVEGEARVREVARMLGGGETEGVVLEHARELLKERS
jgi:DNA repair protein RecN (Recombination protein N)